MKIPIAAKITEALSHFSKQEKVILYVAFAVVGLAVADRLIVRTFSGWITSLDEQIAAQKARTEKDLGFMKLEKSIEQERAEVSSYLVRAKSETEEETALQKEIQEYAGRIKFSAFDMKTSLETSRTRKEGESPAQSYLVAVTCEGTMEQMLEFMYAIETSRRLLTVQRYTLVPKSKDSNKVKATMAITSPVVR